MGPPTTRHRIPDHQPRPPPRQTPSGRDVSPVAEPATDVGDPKVALHPAVSPLLREGESRSVAYRREGDRGSCHPGASMDSVGVRRSSQVESTVGSSAERPPHSYTTADRAATS